MHLNNADGIISHLQRIFIYGDDTQESARMHSFMEYLATHLNPFTQKPYELGERSMYRYIAGEHQFPFDLIIPLVDWSGDELLMADYNIRPSAGAIKKLEVKRDQLAQEISDRQAKLELIDGQLLGATQLTLLKRKAGKP
jgi:hypothetical protein